MLTFIRALPIILMLSGAGYAAHWFIVEQLESRIAALEGDLTQCTTNKLALQQANDAAQRTILGLQQQTQAQLTQIGTITKENNKISAQRDEYLSIFNRHDLYKLARLKPGLIEPRINRATQSVFEQIEADSRETQHENSGSTINSNSIVD